MDDGSMVTALLRLRWPPTPLSRAEGARRADFGPSVGKRHPVASPYHPWPPRGGPQIAWPHRKGGQPVPVNGSESRELGHQVQLLGGAALGGRAPTI